MILKSLINPSEKELTEALKRPVLEQNNLEKTIQTIFTNVEENGDEALKEFSQKFDGIRIENFKVCSAEFIEAETLLSDELKIAIKRAAKNIEKFHSLQKESSVEIETSPGVFCWRKSVPIQRVGLYIPGGSAPLFSTVLMLAIPAKIANVPTKILCSPPNKSGKIHPAILFAAQLAGISTVYKVGGAQAIAAMTIGTDQIEKVDKLFGPGNQYVTAAKQYAQRLGCAIDMPAGPSEVLVAADDSISPEYIAADLLAQAEHGADSQVVFVTNSEKLVTDVNDQLVKQLAYLERAETAKKALELSKAIVIPVENWANTINQYAPEHLILMGKYENEVVEKVANAGSVFLGKYTAESFGDYASGTNHTLPTNGFARSYSGVSLDSFVKKITFQRIEEKGLRDLGPTVVTLANAEELTAHANAISVRLNSLSNTNFSSESKTKTERIEALIRKDLKNVVPYSSARDEFTGNGEVFLDANENGLLTEFNRYPDPFQRKLKAIIAEKKQLKFENLVLGNGSDEIIDLVFRLFGTPLQDSVAYLNPSYGMYSVLAKLNGLSTIEINLNKDFTIETEAILQQARNAKLLVLCNPNNPTGNLMDKTSIETIIQEFEGIVVVDEAYIDFCKEESVADLVDLYPNLIVLQTLSKAYGMAGLRIGMAISNTEIVQKLNGIKAPYNISSAVQELAIDTLNSNNWDEIKAEIIRERNRIENWLNENKSVVKVFPSEANFILFRINQADEVYQKLVEKGVVVRNRSSQYNCENTLRVSIGSPEENDLFMKTLSELN